jgi:hypothetical protein
MDSFTLTLHMKRFAGQKKKSIRESKENAPVLLTAE